MSDRTDKIRRDRKPDFFQQMEPADKQKLEAFARTPKATIKKVYEHLLAEGFTASESAVARWFKRFREEDRIIAANELAAAIHSASAEAGTVDIAGGVNLQIAQRLQEALVRGGNKLPIGDLLKAAIAVNQVGNAEKRLNEEKRKQAEAVKAAEHKAKTGASAGDVVATIKQALGIAA